MQRYSKQEIDRLRDFFRSKSYSEVTVELGSRKFSYFVLPQALEPKLLDFVFRCTGKPEDGYIFGISDKVREDFRPYAVAHEVIEFTEIGIDRHNRCLTALEQELSLVPDNLKREYIEMRHRFFRNLVVYASGKPESFTPEDNAEFRQSLGRLEELVNH